MTVTTHTITAIQHGNIKLPGYHAWYIMHKKYAASSISCKKLYIWRNYYLIAVPQSTLEMPKCVTSNNQNSHTKINVSSILIKIAYHHEKRSRRRSNGY